MEFEQNLKIPRSQFNLYYTELFAFVCHVSVRYSIRSVCTNSVVAYGMRNISFTGFYSRVFSFRSAIRYHRWFEIDRSRSCYFFFFFFFLRCKSKVLINTRVYLMPVIRSLQIERIRKFRLALTGGNITILLTRV